MISVWKCVHCETEKLWKCVYATERVKWLVFLFVCDLLSLQERRNILTPSQRGTYIFKVLCHTGTFFNKIVERRLGMTIEVWRTKRLNNCIWHLFALFDKSHDGQWNTEPAPSILYGTPIDGNVAQPCAVRAKSPVNIPHIRVRSMRRDVRVISLATFYGVILDKRAVS